MTITHTEYLVKRLVCVDHMAGTYEWSEPFWTIATGGSMSASGYTHCDLDGGTTTPETRVTRGVEG